MTLYLVNHFSTIGLVLIIVGGTTAVAVIVIRSSVGVTSRRVVEGVGLAPTHLRAGTARELRRYEWAADTRSVL
ncbi:MAG: hypothetical protein ACRDQ6_16455 [Pseudonocardiaceae bacterium]